MFFTYLNNISHDAVKKEMYNNLLDKKNINNLENPLEGKKIFLPVVKIPFVLGE